MPKNKKRNKERPPSRHLEAWYKDGFFDNGTKMVHVREELWHMSTP
jgi:hypothetical protein